MKLWVEPKMVDNEENNFFDRRYSVILKEAENSCHRLFSFEADCSQFYF